jgi:hypothetical protein
VRAALLVALTAGCSGVTSSDRDLAAPEDLALKVQKDLSPPNDLASTVQKDLAPPDDLASTVQNDLAAQADLAMNDFSAPDLYTSPDLQMQSQLDLAQPDLTNFDLSEPPDLALTLPPDLALDLSMQLPDDLAAIDLATSDLACSPSCPNGCFQGACSTPLFLGNSDAFITGTGTHVGLRGGGAQAGTSVSAITQTFPTGEASVHLIYSVNDRSFANAVDLLMIYDHLQGNNDQWYAIIPAQAAGAHVYWYLRADPTVPGVPTFDPHGAPADDALDYTSN